MNTFFNPADKLFQLRKEVLELIVLYNEPETIIKNKIKRINRHSRLLRDKDMNLIVIDNRLINKYKWKEDYCETETEFEEE